MYCLGTWQGHKAPQDRTSGYLCCPWPSLVPGSGSAELHPQPLCLPPPPPSAPFPAPLSAGIWGSGSVNMGHLQRWVETFSVVSAGEGCTPLAETFPPAHPTPPKSWSVSATIRTSGGSPIQEVSLHRGRWSLKTTQPCPVYGERGVLPVLKFESACSDHDPVALKVGS